MIWNTKTIGGLLMVVPLLTVLAWWGVYEYGVRQLEDAVAVFTEKLLGKGYKVTYGKLSFSGTPVLMHMNWENLQVQDTSGTYQFTIPEFEFTARPWDYTNISFQAKKGVNIVASLLNRFKWSAIDTGNVEGSFQLDDGFKVQDLQFYTENVQPKILNTKAPLSFDVLQGEFFGLKDPLALSGSLLMRIDGVGDAIGVNKFKFPLKLGLEFELSGLQANSTFSDIQQWSRAGGFIELKNIDIDWELLQVNGDGSLTFDEKMRPMGAFSLVFQEYDTTLSMLVEAGYIKKKNADSVSFVLRLIEGKPALGRKEVAIPVTLQNGYGRVGPVKLFKLYPIEPKDSPMSLPQPPAN
jgi:hypothetical protein